MEIDWTQLGTGIAGLVTGCGVAILGLYKFAIKHRSRMTEQEADVAANQAERSVADAQKLVYDSLMSRIQALETDVGTVRNELAEERRVSRALAARNLQLELHVKHLEFLMKASGIDVPVLRATTVEGGL